MINVKITTEIKNFFRNIRNNSFFFILVSIFWFIFRVGTKPTRITYPCQRNILSMLVLNFEYLAASFTTTTSNFTKNILTKKFTSKYITIKNITILIIACLLASGIYFAEQLITRDIEQRQLYESSHHNPITGFAVAGVPPEVVRIHDADATSWNHVTPYAWDYVSQSVVNSMVSRGIRELTGKATDAEAWRSIINYQSGETVAIKINMNNIRYNNRSDWDSVRQKIQPPYQTIKAVVDGLASIGVPLNKIIIYDVTRAIHNKYRETIPGVTFVDDLSASPYSTAKPQFTHSNLQGANPCQTECPWIQYLALAQPLVDAKHVIDIAQMKAHNSYCQYGVTLTFKNHLGSVNCPSCLHKGGVCSDIYSNQNALVDLYKNTNIKDKTRLLIIDGLYGTIHDQIELPQKWRIFNYDSPNSLFFAFDPVAIDSVVYDYISEEKGTTPHHNYLHDAANEGLGVHEHGINHKYTEIQYTEVDLDAPTLCSDGTAYGSCSVSKPKYCDNGNLINKCSFCGCSSGYTCNTTSQACYIPSTGCQSGEISIGQESCLSNQVCCCNQI